MPLLHLHEILANDQTHLHKEAENRRAPPQHLRPPSEGSLGIWKTESFSGFLLSPTLPIIYFKGMLKEQVVLVTSVEKFNDGRKHLSAISD